MKNIPALIKLTLVFIAAKIILKKGGTLFYVSSKFHHDITSHCLFIKGLVLKVHTIYE